MADNDQQVHPMPQSSDQATEFRGQKKKKWALYIAFVIFLTGIILLFSFIVMKFRTITFHVRPSNSFDIFDVQPSTPSFNMRLNAQLGVRNTDFGPLKYDNAAITFYYKGTEVGSATVPKSKANFLSTKTVNVPVDLVMPIALACSSDLISDLNSGILPLTSLSKLKGNVEIMFVFKKKRTANMNCTMEINIAIEELQNIKCK